MHGIAATQPYVIALFLAWAGLMKLFSRRMRARAGQTALARLVGATRAVPALRLVGVAELAVAAVLLLPPVSPWMGPVTALLAALLSAGFLAYLTYSYVAAPTASCGCLGAHSKPVDVRAFARAGLLLAASLLAVPADPGPPLVALGLAEAVALMALSAELDRYWLTPLRRLRVRLRAPLAVPPSEDVPLGASLHLLYHSPAYCSASAQITSDVQDTWDEDGLRFVVFGARERTAVFAIPLAGNDPTAVLVTLVAA
ncbi:MauE/DoxX family redox-associated membrane protein [Nonomuraea sp. NPDC050153]|uniref:MauE/DoxX family redox-associated membrane protein n=1 Tax=Nonomuraea sp. NPDC050153 TaxID=3364359 RepID=UPI00378B6A75